MVILKNREHIGSTSAAPLRRGRTVASTAAWAGVTLTALPAAYLGVLSGAAVLADRSSRRSVRLAHEMPPSLRFAIIVPAHDEATVIEACVASLMAQRYRSDLFTVNVVADNCTDDTADRARAAGARAFERNDLDDRGKGAALNWIRDQIGSEAHDVIVVIDADTIADGGMLAAFAREFESGAAVVQGEYGVLDPESAPTVALRFAALACRHRLRPAGRARLGCSSGLYGNAMAFRTEILHERNWSGHLVEDAELQLQLLLDGIAVRFAPEARVAAEMPSSWDGAVSQHQRWELGRFQLIRTFGPSLARSAVSRAQSGRSRSDVPVLPRRAYVDALVDQLVPPMSVLVAGQVAAAGVAGLTGVVTRRRSATVLAVLSLTVTAVHVLTALRLAEAPRSVWRSLAAVPRLVGWKMALLLRVARQPDEVVWTRTERNPVSADPFLVTLGAGV